MPSVMEELYYGNIRPDGGDSAGANTPVSEAARLRAANYQKLSASLNTEQSEILDKYCCADSEWSEALRYKTFQYGLKLGVLLMTEIFTGQRQVTGREE